MATWSTTNTRNVVFTGGTTAAIRGYQLLSFLDYYLCDPAAGAASWTRIGSGGGTGSGLYGWSAAKVLPTFPAVTGMANLAWACWENAAGAQLCVQMTQNGWPQGIWWSASGGFVVGVTDEDTPPTGTPPADIVSHTAGGGVDFGGAVASPTCSMAYTTDNNSFIFFTNRNNVDDFGACFIMLEETKVGDTQPFWCWFRGQSGVTMWKPAELTYGSSNYGLGYHPTTGQQIYSLSEAIYVRSIYPMDTIGADPVSGDVPRVDSICVCGTAGSLHIRGKVPGIYRVPTALGTGDRIDDAGGGVYTYVVIGTYCVPWGSSDALLW